MITYAGGSPILPDLILTSSYAASADSATVTHTILDGPPVHTLRPAGPDAGTLELLFADELQARDCYTAHKLGAVFTITDPTRLLLNFDYVLAAGGRPQMTLDPQGRRRWLVTVPYQVVIA